MIFEIRKILASLSITGSLLFATSVEAKSLSVSVELKNLSGQHIVNNEIETIALRELDCNFSPDRKRGRGWYVCSPERLSDNSFDLYTIEIKPASDNSYFSRTIEIQNRKRNEPIDLKLYLVDRNAKFTYNSLEDNLKYIEGEDYDRALAFYETAHNNMSRNSFEKYHVKLRYNYARTLKDICLTGAIGLNSNRRIQYNTCDRAKKQFEYLLDKHNNIVDRFKFKQVEFFADWETRLNRAIQELNNAQDINSLKLRAIASQYQQAIQLYDRGQKLQAAREFQQLLERQKQEPKLFANAGLSRADLLEDRGTALTAASEFMATPQERKLLIEAKRAYREAAELNPRRNYRDDIDYLDTLIQMSAE